MKNVLKAPTRTYKLIHRVYIYTRLISITSKGELELTNSACDLQREIETIDPYNLKQPRSTMENLFSQFGENSMRKLVK